ncbi:MAG: glycosyltransferase [Acidimicrobiia bacterium]
MASRRPELNFVLVGPVDDRVADEAAALGRLSNVTLHPAQPAEKVASFVRGFDVGLIPFVVDEMTRGVTPLKMFEYLASGVPVVATPLPACVDHPAVETASEPGSFAALIAAAVKMVPEQRSSLRHAAEDASWERRLQPLLDRLDALGLRRV